MTVDVKAELNARKNLFEASLNEWCDRRPPAAPPRIWEAMTYSLLGGGKRLRPVLCMAAAELFGSPPKNVFPMALALEMVHTASLIHDDLPAMDDDSLRRGHPTNHVVYGEALAILAGDALLTHAFQLPLQALSGLVPAERIVAAMADFAQALGAQGICGGQVLDMEGDLSGLSDATPLVIAELKTAALIRTSLVTGAILAGADDDAQKALNRYGLELGVAFQIADDILDVVGEQESMGKSLGKDQDQNKRTFISEYGLEGARECLSRRTKNAVEYMRSFGASGTFLRELVLYLEHRTQ